MAGESFDVVIIGSGAGGGASAWALSEAGLDVVLLEAGPEYNPLTDYRLDQPTWELSGFPEKVPSVGRQTIAPLQTLDPARSDLRSWNKVSGPYGFPNERRPLGYAHCVGLGGTTLRYTGEAHRLHPAAMQMNTRFGVAADWPVDYATLEPFYVEAEYITGCAGPNDDPIRTRSASYPTPPHTMSYASSQLAAGGSVLGLGFVPNSVAAPSQPFDGRPNCNYCGNCTRGCPRLDKGSVDITFIAKARANGHCVVKTNTPVTRIEAGADDRVVAVHYIEEGEDKRVAACAVVVACGAVETPRLLLNSESARAPEGLANEAGHVGQHFMETVFRLVSGLHPGALASFRGHPSDIICWDYNAPDSIPGVVGGCRFSPGVGEADLVGPVSYATRVVAGWGLEHKRKMRETFGRVLAVGSVGESLPNSGSFIDLDPNLVDEGGAPRARIHSRVEDTDVERLRFMTNLCREILAAAGVEEIFEEYGSYDLFMPTHVSGTCRMGDDPELSVVDRHGRSHRWRNLFVADASVFPSSGGGESPALTIQALAIRTARHIAKLASRREL